MQMKKHYLFSLGLITILMLSFVAPAQTAFHRGSLILNISEGSTTGMYSTREGGKIQHRECQHGLRDPFVLEYGFTDRWSVGFSSGTDIFKVNTNAYYGYRASDAMSNTLNANTNEFTFDFSYHPYVTKHWDISTYASFGFFGVSLNDCSSDIRNNYNSKGSIIRAGVKARYYFSKRFGVLGMVSTYSGAASSTRQGAGVSTFGNGYSTIITGYAVEFGLCARLFK
jgi:hypothetical protein